MKGWTGVKGPSISTSHNLDSVIFSVANDDSAILGQGQTFDAFDLPFHGSPRQETRVKAAVRSENLNSIVAWIANENESFSIKKDSAWIFELTIMRPLATDSLYVLASWREDLNPMISRIW